MSENRTCRNDEILEDIKNNMELGKLSIFVGAGVSRLSGYPSWYSLVKEMADELEYESSAKAFISEQLSQMSKATSIDNSAKKIDVDNISYNFTTDELLKIPQMYFNKVGKEKYNEKVKSVFDKDCKPNFVHNLIMSMNPNHILTTNYDTLIEETAIKYGRNFSVLNSDKAVANSTNLNYIVKVHGDFSGDFVLKEDDYLNYENNYVLIENIVKMIFSTNLVIFVGYGLNDYNIKLILNWVKRAQNDDFKPVFIYTGEKVTENERNYQEKKGIRFIDCNDYADSNDYYEKYSRVFEQIFKYSKTLDSNEAKLDYLYEKIIGVKNLQFIRKEDFDSIFENEYMLNDYREIVNLSKVDSDRYKTKVNYFEYFYACKNGSHKTDKNKFNEINKFIEKTLIIGMLDNSVKKVAHFTLNTENLYFCNNYKYMESFVIKEHDNIIDNFKKAYYLARIGEYEKSYDLYIKISEMAYKSKQWDVYYFSQINRWYIFKVLENLRSTMFYASRFDYNFIDRICKDMVYFRLEDQFNQLTGEFKSKYKSLSIFSQPNVYINKYYELSKLKYGIDVENYKCSNRIVRLEFDDIKRYMVENLQFLYENMILFDMFTANELYIKNSITIWLKANKKYDNEEKNANVAYLNQIEKTSDDYLKLNDIILISKTFKVKDLILLDNEVELKEIKFKEVEDLEKYIKKEMNNYSINNEITRKKSLNVNANYSEELLSLLSLSQFFIKDNILKLNCLNFIINMEYTSYIIEKTINIVKKCIDLECIKGTSFIIEDWCVKMTYRFFESEEDEIISAVAELEQVVDLYCFTRKTEGFDDNVSNKVSNIIINNVDSKNFKKLNEPHFFGGLNKYGFLKITNDEATLILADT